ncbi:MAG TPA: VOC family protein [Opitutaceae bacterium]|nr:VOC family protein [Opitutaceae bacterium]
MSHTLELRHVTLRVPNLDRSLEFYVGQVGFELTRRQPADAELSVAPGAPPLLSLVEDARAPAAPRDAAGLFHAALLFPSRSDLGAWLLVAARRKLSFDGFSDHRVSEALYFSDPDGNGLEFYADRPRSEWPMKAGEVEMVTAPLDLDSLLGAAAAPADHPLAGARWGHLHLRVTELDRSERFYTEALGMQVTQRSYPDARFLAADGYHHHLGLNRWGGIRQPQPPGALGLVEATFARAGAASPKGGRDPDGLALRVVPL